MKESATTALSYIKSQAKELGIEPERFENTDIHIHVPQGAIPKDGPSAGITMLSALTSALLNKKMKAGLAMTCLLYTSPSPRDKRQSRMPSSA